MSQFDHSHPSDPITKQFKQAKVRFGLSTLLYGLVLLFAVLVFSVWLFLLRSVNLDIQPNDASIDIEIDTIEGFAISYEKGFYFIGAIPTTIQIAADGFVVKTIRLDEHLDETLRINMEPIAPIVTASTNIDDSSLQWFVNGEQLHQGVSFSKAIDVGEQTISVSHPHYQPISEKIVTKRGGVHRLFFQLKAVEGSLKVTSKPTGQTLYIEGNVVGTTPQNLKMKPGKHQLSIESKGYDTRYDLIDITVDQSVIERHYILNPKKAYIDFILYPEGGQLLVNNKLVDGSEAQSFVSNKALEINYEKDGYIKATNNIKLLPGELKVIEFDLKQAIGSLAITSKPRANIYIDGQLFAKTPISIDIPAATYTIQAKAPGYQVFKQEIELSYNKALALNIELKSLSEILQDQADQHFASKLGIVMLNVMPDAITIGSPANEKGRIRNEHLRQIQFTKQLAISKYEITNKQYQAFNIEHASLDQLPVTNITWNQAAEFCNWLSQKEGLQQFYRFNADGKYEGYNAKANGYRLPTEAEWEWLARKAGKDTTTKFIWGDDSTVPKQAGNLADASAQGTTKRMIPNYQDGYIKTAPVGSFKQNILGIYDLIGNVSEWTHDLYSFAKPNQKVYTDPMGPQPNHSNSLKHVVKGSSWASATLRELRASYRKAGRNPSDKIGFRIARSVMNVQ